MLKRKISTLYSVQYKNKQNIFNIVGLFKDCDSAIAFRDFLNENTCLDLGEYIICEITTDLRG